MHYPQTAWLDEKLDDRKQDHLYRYLRSAKPLANGQLILEGKTCLNMCSNDYLGIMDRLNVNALAAGATASRLISGNHESIRLLEKELAAFHNTEAALVFSNGYMANLSCLTAFMGRGDAIFSDKLNHASIIDGARLSDADHIRYKHNDLDQLEFLLQKSDFR